MKIFFKILGALIILILLGIAGLIFTFDPNNYKEQLTQQVEQQTGREFNVEGDIKLTLFPWIGIELGKVSLGNAEGFSEKNFAEISTLDVKVMVLPLIFKQEVQVDKLRLHGLAVSLEVNKDGVNNWQDLAKPSGKEEAGKKEKQEEAAPVEDKSGAALAGIAVSGIEFVGANAQWSDVQTDTKASVSDLNFETGAIEFNKPVAIKFSAQVKSNQPEVDAKITLNTNVTFNETLDQFNVDGLNLNVQTLMQSIAKEMITLDFKTSLQANLKQQTASIKAMRLSAMGVELSGDFDITNLDAEPIIKGTISSNAINGRAVAQKLGVELPPMANANSLSKVMLSSNVDATPKSVRLDKFNVTLDQTQINGWVHVLDMAQPNVEYNLKMTAINLDDYMPPPPPETDKPVAAELPEQTTGTSEDVAIALPVELLRKLGLSGKFAIDKVTVKEIDVTDIDINTQAGGGLLRVKPVSMKLLQGSMAMGLDLNVIKTPEYTISLDAKNIVAGPVVDPIIKDLSGDENIRLEGGAASMKVDIVAQGESVNALKQSANGKLSFNIDQTTLSNVDVEYLVLGDVSETLEKNKETIALLNQYGYKIPEKWYDGYTPKDKTAFRVIRASAALANGKLKNEDFLMDSSKVKVTGKGEVDYVNNTMDYYALVDLNRSQNKTTLEKILNEPMGYRVYGPLNQPEWSFDKARIRVMVKDLAKEKVKAKTTKKIEQKKEEVKQKATEKIEDKLKDKLKGLFR